jgi:phosphotriesterase-related protein
VMSHIDRTLFDRDSMLALADTGCVLEFDLFGTESSYYPQDPTVDLPNDGIRVGHIRALIAAGHVDRLLISEDVCRKTQLVRYGGEGYAHILRRVLPLMLARGIDGADIRRITRTNAARLLTTDR